MSEASRVEEFPREMNRLTGQIEQGGMVQNRSLLILGLSDQEKETIATRPEAFITYRLYYQCKHCGKKWTKLSVEKKPIPREYLEDETEKTDLDAHVEEEEEREKEYSRAY